MFWANDPWISYLEVKGHGLRSSHLQQLFYLPAYSWTADGSDISVTLVDSAIEVQVLYKMTYGFNTRNRWRDSNYHLPTWSRSAESAVVTIDDGSDFLFLGYSSHSSHIYERSVLQGALLIKFEKFCVSSLLPMVTFCFYDVWNQSKYWGGSFTT